MMMKPKFAAIMPVFVSDEFIEQAVANVVPHVERVFILLNDRPWDPDRPYEWPDDDETESKCNLLKKTFDKVDLVKGYWGPRVAAENWAMDRIRSEHRELTHAFWIDYDEAFRPDHYEALSDFVGFHQESIKAFYCKRRVYWHCTRLMVDPMESAQVLIANDLKTGPPYFSQFRRTPQCPTIAIPESVAYQHHWSYVRKNKIRMKLKIETFDHAHEVLPFWYEKIWLGWKPGMEDLHPTVPTEYKRIVWSDPKTIPSQFLQLTEYLWSENLPDFETFVEEGALGPCPWKVPCH
jgi:hypothetical protein